MNDVEQMALALLLIQPLILKRYVKDVISEAFVNEMIHLLLQLNSLEPSIQFTCECENEVFGMPRLKCL